MIDPTHPGEVLRYRKRPRIVHALLASSFVLLLLTGVLLLWGPLSGLAAAGNSRWIHRIAAIAYMAVPIVYLAIDRAGAKELLIDSFKYDRDDWEWLKHIGRYAIGRAKEMPPQGRLNAGQKLHHASVILVSASIVVSGLALWFWKEPLGASGTAWAAIIHDASMVVLTLLLVGHLYFTFVYQALSGMTTGYVPETEARLEHSKWVEELEHAAEAAAFEEETAGSAAPQTE
jgi:formate dehydrogenase subunit gamma